jgi:hypothetical protein
VESLFHLEYEASYIPGPQNPAADALSRRSSFDPEEDGGRGRHGFASISESVPPRCGCREDGVRVRHGAFMSESVPGSPSVDFEEVGVRVEHGASTSESVPRTVDFLLLISYCGFRGGWGQREARGFYL